MICPSCGTDNTPDRKYCGLCGHFLAQSAAAAPPPVQPAPAQPLTTTTRDLKAPQTDRPQQQLGPTAKLPPRPVASGAAAQPAPDLQQDAPAQPEQSLFADAFRYALSWRPLSLLTIGFFCSMMVLFFSLIIKSVIIKLMMSGDSSLDSIAVFGVIMMGLTLLVCYVIEIIFLSATAKMCYERLTSGRALRRAEAMKFAVSNGATVIIAPFLFVLATVIVLLVEYLIFLLGSTKAIGPVVTGIFFPPFIVINAVLFFVINYAIWMALITVSSGTRSIGETVSKTKNLVKRSLRTHVPELFSLTLVQGLIALLGIMIVGTGFVLTSAVAGWGGAGVPVEMIVTGGVAHAIDLLVLDSIYNASLFGHLLGLLALGGGLALILGMLLAFPRVFFANGCIRVYQRLVNDASAQD